MPTLSKSTLTDRLMQAIFTLNGLFCVGVLLGIFGILIMNTLPMFSEIRLVSFLTGTLWNPDAWGVPQFGMLSMLVSTLMVSLLAMVIAVPVGIGTAAYLSDVATPKTRDFVKPMVEILAGIPSVVIGFIGIVLVGPLLAGVFNLPNGLNAINGAILLAIMALPTIISLSEDALFAVPKSLEEASLALGATRWQTVTRVKIPAAMSGIIAACVLGMGRVIGETMTVLMATGCATAMPHSVADSVRTFTSTIAIELGEVPYDTTHYYALFGIGLVLFIITFAVNLIADIALSRYQWRRS